MINRLISVFLVLAFFASDISVYAQGIPLLSEPGMRVSLSPDLAPPLLKGIRVYPNDPFRFDFILDRGVGAGLVPALDKGRPQGSPLHDESNRLIKYFLAALTIPEKDLWVNLSPYEKDRIVPDAFGQTEMGRDLLAQDYILKQITASLMYPEGDVGKKFWAKVYAAMQEKYGTTDIPVDTFNKVWIVPQRAEVFENGNAAYVVGSRLKVMLETDYLAMNANQGGSQTRPYITDVQHDVIDGRRGGFQTRPEQELTREILRSILIPILENEVNEGANFAQLRQVYNSLILATWFKRKIVGAVHEPPHIHESPLQGYIDHNKTVGVDIADKNEKEKIWTQYVEAFKNGVFNYIADDAVRARHGVPEMGSPRQYFSGGASMRLSGVLTSTINAQKLPLGHDNAMIVNVNVAAVDETHHKKVIFDDFFSYKYLHPNDDLRPWLGVDPEANPVSVSMEHIQDDANSSKMERFNHALKGFLKKSTFLVLKGALGHVFPNTLDAMYRVRDDEWRLNVGRLDPINIPVRLEESERGITIRIEDSGHGIPYDVLDKWHRFAEGSYSADKDIGGFFGKNGIGSKYVFGYLQKIGAKVTISTFSSGKYYRFIQNSDGSRDLIGSSGHGLGT
ncbi:MAG: hypothetical protein V2A70_09690, partial [Candidatus Omnitrophota bacterium]